MLKASNNSKGVSRGQSYNLLIFYICSPISAVIRTATLHIAGDLPAVSTPSERDYDQLRNTKIFRIGEIQTVSLC